MPKVFLGLGSNLGNKVRYLEKAVLLLGIHDEISLIKKSSDYENPAIEDAGPNDFINAVLQIETELKPRDLLNYILKIEKALGRTRSENGIKLARTIDIDILTYGDEQINESDLKIPHPKMLERDFVMKPLLEINPNWYRGEKNRTRVLKQEVTRV